MNLTRLSYSQSQTPISRPKINSAVKNHDILGLRIEKDYSLLNSESNAYTSDIGGMIDNKKRANNEISNNGILNLNLTHRNNMLGNFSKHNLRDTVSDSGSKPRFNLFSNYNYNSNYEYKNNQRTIGMEILPNSTVKDCNTNGSIFFNDYQPRSNIEEYSDMQVGQNDSILLKSSNRDFQIDYGLDDSHKYRKVLYGRKGNGDKSRLATIEESLICIEFVNNMKRASGSEVMEHSKYNRKNHGEHLGIKNKASFTYSPKNSSSINQSPKQYYLISDTEKAENEKTNRENGLGVSLNFSLETTDKRERSYSEPNRQNIEKDSYSKFPLYKRFSFSSFVNNDYNSHKIPGIHEGCLSKDDRCYLHDIHRKEGSNYSYGVRAADYSKLSPGKILQKDLGGKSVNKITDLLNEEPMLGEQSNSFSRNNSRNTGFFRYNTDDISSAAHSEKFSRKLSKNSENKLKSNNKKRSPKTLKHGICVQCGITETTQWRTINIYSEGKVCNSCGMFSNKLESMFGKVVTEMILQRKKQNGTSSERKMSTIFKEHQDLIEQFGDKKH